MPELQLPPTKDVAKLAVERAVRSVAREYRRHDHGLEAQGYSMQVT
jgi:hypothetical protein